MMQGTVKSFDRATGRGVILTDDRREWAITPEAFGRSGLRLLQLGQRVKFEAATDAVGDATHVTYVNILTLPDPE